MLLLAEKKAGKQLLGIGLLTNLTPPGLLLVVFALQYSRNR